MNRDSHDDNPAPTEAVSEATMHRAVRPDATRMREEQSGVVPSSRSELRPGDVVRDRFVIDSVLGVGGMGMVYRALDRRKEEAADRDPYVALKVLNEDFHSNPKMAIALQREARKAQTLAHPSIVTVYDFDRDGERAYVTMEMLTGRPLDDFIREHPNGIPRARALPVIRGMSLGLAYAHNKQIIHSDFKPGNVFITAGDRPRILDFGIARAAPASSAPQGDVLANVEASDITRFDAGDLGALTPSYASLEMWERKDPHPSDDVYALAIVTYEILAGHHPFDNAPAPKAKAERLVPKPIAGLKRREWRAIRHGLAFERERRTANATEFLREFEGASRLRLFLIGTAVALALAVGYAAYQDYQSRQAALPAVPFQQLPTDVQTRFSTFMEEGATLERFADPAGALDRYGRAYRLHPRNPEAVVAIEQLLVRFAAAAVEGGQAHDLNAVAENLDAVLAIDDFLGARPGLVEARAAVEQAKRSARP